MHSYGRRSAPVHCCRSAAGKTPSIIVRPLFGFVPPGLPDFLLIGSLVTGYIVLVELVKIWYYREGADHGTK